MGIKTRLEKLEQRAERHYDVLPLPDGREVLYYPDEALKALSATIAEEEQKLIPHFLSAGQTTGLPGLVRALEVSRERIEQEASKDGS